VLGSLLSPDNQDRFHSDIRIEYEKLREGHLSRQRDKSYALLADARKNKVKIDWEKTRVSKPSFTGNRVFKDYDLSEIASYIDWTPFFQTWELGGRYPNILEDPLKGEEARKLFADAQEMLERILTEKWLRANAVVGFYPANSVDDDDIEVYADEDRSSRIARFCNLRQQGVKSGKVPNICLSDFIAPKSTGIADYIGGFALTTGIGIEARLRTFEESHDDYSAILLKALADRLAEAFAELLHARVRRELWGYAPDETLSTDELIAEKYAGIRPAPGYPANPDHTEKQTLFRLLDVSGQTGISLTETLAMYPASSVSGLYFSHPESRYFGVGKITREQVESYAKRKEMSIEEMERWLSPALAY
jgi:5-methyltetrahydrofolate--homocysteine methyltransferase